MGTTKITSYQDEVSRLQQQLSQAHAAGDKDAEIEPTPTDAHGYRPEAELDRPSNILKTSNDQFGTLLPDGDQLAKRIRDNIAPKFGRASFLPECEGEHAAPPQSSKKIESVERPNLSSRVSRG